MFLNEDGNVLCVIKSGNVLCFRAASMHELKEMAAEVTSIIEEPSTSQVTSDVTSQFASDVDSEVAASEVAVSEVSATDVASKITSALAATEAPA